jgi:hypothetical protein
VLTADDGRAVHYVFDGSVGKPKDGDPGVLPGARFHRAG